MVRYGTGMSKPTSPPHAPSLPAPATPADERTLAVRRRLEDAMAAAVAEKGLAATTIADVARHAGTSKRTFYEHYADKTECYLSLFATRSAAMVAAGGCRAAPR